MKTKRHAKIAQRDLRGSICEIIENAERRCANAQKLNNAHAVEFERGMIAGLAALAALYSIDTNRAEVTQ